MSDYFKSAYTLLNPEQKQKEWHEGKINSCSEKVNSSIVFILNDIELEEQICSVCPSLTFQQRIIGCLTCLVVGFLISMGSTFRLIKLLEGDPEPFAVMYTIGNILGICSTCFLYGPMSQVKQMFAATR